MSLRWDVSRVADAIATVIADREAELRLEQAVYGVDSADERQLQELLAAGLGKCWSVAREAHYPSSASQKLSHRQRCDLVLAESGRPIRLDNRPPTLFEPADRTPAGEALWLEVKAAWQFREGGVRHGGYGTQWRTAVVNDLAKMSVEPMIREAAMVLLAFGESQEMLQRDLESFEMVLIEKDVLAGFRQVRMVPITERIGHHACGVAVYPTVQRETDGGA